MSNKGKIYLVLIILSVATVLFLIKTSPDEVSVTPSPSVTPTPEVSSLDTQRGITVISVKENQIVSSPLKISGFVSGNEWAPFEAQAGTVELVDENGTRLAFGLLTTPGDWMQLPSYFETTLRFSSGYAKTGTLIFRNDNPSGLPENKREYRLPVQFKILDIIYN